MLTGLGNQRVNGGIAFQLAQRIDQPAPVRQLGVIQPQGYFPCLRGPGPVLEVGAQPRAHDMIARDVRLERDQVIDRLEQFILGRAHDLAGPEPAAQQCDVVAVQRGRPVLNRQRALGFIHALENLGNAQGGGQAALPQRFGMGQHLQGFGLGVMTQDVGGQTGGGIGRLGPRIQMFGINAPQGPAIGPVHARFQQAFGCGKITRTDLQEACEQALGFTIVAAFQRAVTQFPQVAAIAFRRGSRPFHFQPQQARLVLFPHPFVSLRQQGFHFPRDFRFFLQRFQHADHHLELSRTDQTARILDNQAKVRTRQGLSRRWRNQRDDGIAHAYPAMTAGVTGASLRKAGGVSIVS